MESCLMHRTWRVQGSGVSALNGMHIRKSKKVGQRCTKPPRSCTLGSREFQTGSSDIPDVTPGRSNCIAAVAESSGERCAIPTVPFQPPHNPLPPTLPPALNILLFLPPVSSAPGSRKLPRNFGNSLNSAQSTATAFRYSPQ